MGLVETLSYRDDGSQWEVSIPSRSEATHDVTPVGDVSLENFLSRPIFLPARTWTPGVAGFTYQFNPWEVFLSNKRVSNRLNNYQLLSCNLCVKIMVNGNGFYYGRLMADYRFGTGQDVVCLDDGTAAGEAIPASQRMHIFIDPMTSQGGCLRIPFFSLRNAFSVTLGDWSSSNVGGLITVRELNPLKHANGASTPVELVFSVWAEDVKLSVPTATAALGLTAQAGEETGAVSRVASAVTNAASLMNMIPSFAPYATAVSMASRGIGAMAKQFGFSRPTIDTPPAAVRPTYVGNLANGDQGENLTKLTLDSKQGLTIDPSVIGFPTPDEMDISLLLKRESLLTTVPWTVAATTDALLWNTRVTPMVFSAYSSVYYLPACMFASVPFTYWRGCLKYRIQIVASQFHKGRLRICWDPNLVPAAPEANVEYTRVVDISTERDLEIIVKWGQPYTWLKCGSGTNVNHYTSRISTVTADSHNGILSVFVLNSLTTPNSVANNDISMNVFVSMDEGEVAVPTDAVYRLYYNPYAVTVQSGDEEVVPQNNDPVSVLPTVEDISDCRTHPAQNLVFIGEVFSSFRTLLKRYNFYRTDLCPNTTSPALWTLRGPNWPAYRGYGFYTHDASATGKKVNYVASTLLNYLAPAYTVARGGIRWKAILYTSAPNEILSPLSVERGADFTTPPYSSATTDFAGLGTTSAYTANNNATFRGGMFKGGAITPHARQPALEFELPFYSQERGMYIRNVTGSPGSYASPWQYQHQYQLTTTGTTPKYLDRYVGVGEDFQLLLFQGCPGITYNPALPAPA